ncbi:MAG: hypothetical protein FWE71_03120 [Nocardioidaceae bacterium]|nr:hypothetical protein [Nocardioidaceae bacterium]MCL2612189.1 hypothetical protein [Nocardioidaceae bacterium]
MGLLLALAACGSHPRSGPTAVTTYSADNGPLEFGTGGQALDPPRHFRRLWSASIGQFFLCSHGSIPIVLTGVKTKSAGLVNVRALVHRVTPSSLTRVPAKRRWRYGVFGSSLGAPPRFDGSGTSPLGSYSTAIDGLKVPTCRDDERWDSQLSRGQIPGGTYTELVIAASTDRHGGRLQQLWVDFTMAGRPAREQLGWKLILCGDDPQLASMCR